MIPVRYYLPPPKTKGDVFAIRGLAIREKMPPMVVRRSERAADYLFMLFHDTAFFGTGTASREISPCALFIWNPGVGRCYGNATASWTHSWLLCDGPGPGRRWRPPACR